MDIKSRNDSEEGSFYYLRFMSFKMPRKLICQNLKIISGSFISRYKCNFELFLYILNLTTLYFTFISKFWYLRSSILNVIK